MTGPATAARPPDGPPLYDSLATVYDRWLSGDEAAEPCGRFYAEELAGEPGPVLELGCGTGRICSALALAGTRLVGLDLSMQMLARARLRVAGRPGPVPGLTCGRFQALPFAGNAFAAAILPMRTVGHLTDPAGRTATFQEVHRVLRPGGRFLLDHYNLDAGWAREHDGEPRLMFAGPVTGAEDRALLIWDRYDYDFPAQTLRCTVHIDEVGLGGRPVTSDEVVFAFRWFAVDELVAHGRDAGFLVEGCWGSFDHTPYRPDADHIVVDFRKP